MLCALAAVVPVVAVAAAAQDYVSANAGGTTQHCQIAVITKLKTILIVMLLFVLLLLAETKSLVVRPPSSFLIRYP